MHFIRIITALLLTLSVLTTALAAQNLSGVSTPIKTQTGKTVQLDPTDGFSYDGQTSLRSQWSWVSRPDLSVADFSDTARLRPLVTIDVPGTYAARLDLFDANDATATTPLVSTDLEISTENTRPVSLVSPRSLPASDAPLFLDGTGSFDLDGDALSYAWSVISVPDAAQLEFVDPTAAISEVRYDGSGRFELALTVTDQTGRASEPTPFVFEILSGSTDAATLDLQSSLQTFNLITQSFFGRQEVEGRTYIGSTIEGTNGQFGFQPADDDLVYDELYVDGDVVNSNINLTPGDVARISGQKIQSNINNGSAIEQADGFPDFDFALFKRQSGFLASLSGDRPDISDQNNKRFGGAPNSLASEAGFGPNTRIVTASLQDLQSGGYTIDVSQSETVIINVSGQSGTFQMNPLGGTGSAENVLWNFHEATSITVNSVIMGHVLAPYAEMSGFSGSSEGTVIAASVNLTNGELHQRAWLGQIPASLEPEADTRVLAPTANLRFDQIAGLVDVPLLLEPFASVDIDGGRLSSDITVLSAPLEATPSLVENSDGVATFQVDQPDDYLLGLSVSDGQRVAQDQILVSIGGENVRPAAIIGDLPNAAVGAASSLDGTQSFDLDGDLLSYRWSLLSQPAGSSAALENDNEPLAALTPDSEGLYVLQLIVNDGQADSVPATLPMVVGASLPIADAGRDLLLDQDGRAGLDAGFSSGTGLEFSWSVLGLTDGAGSLDDGTLVMPTLTLPAQTDVLSDAVSSQTVYEINRNDRGGLCAFDVQQPSDITNPASSGWHGIAFWASGTTNDGSNRPIWVLDNQQDTTRTVELISTDGNSYGSYVIPGRTRAYLSTDPLAQSAQMRVILDGNQIGQSGPANYAFNRADAVCAGAGTELAQVIVANANGISRPQTVFVGNTALRPELRRAPAVVSTGGAAVTLSAVSQAYDANGDDLNFSWSLLYRPDGSDATISGGQGSGKATGDSIPFKGDRPGTYLIQLEANDGTFQAVPAVFVVEILGQPPVAIASGGGSVFVGETAILNGAGSFDPDGDALSYNWTILSRPNGSQANIPDPFGPNASFIPDQQGTYTFGLDVGDGFVTSSANIVTLQVPNRVPSVEISGPSTAPVGQLNLFETTGADLDGDDLEYVWALLSAPEDSQTTISVLGETGNFEFIADFPGEYVFEVTISDGFENVSQTISLTADPSMQALELGALAQSYPVDAGDKLTINLTSEGGRGIDKTYFIEPLPLPSGLSLNADSGRLVFETTPDQVGNYEFRLGVSDGVDVAVQTISIEVSPGTAQSTGIRGRVVSAEGYGTGDPVPLADVEVIASRSGLTTRTDEDGFFEIDALSVLKDTLFINADAAANEFERTEAAFSAKQDRLTQLENDILLANVAEGCAVVTAGQDTVLVAPNGVSISVPADSVLDQDGEAYTGNVCLGALPQLYAHPGLPHGTNACQIYSVSAPQATFSQGIALSVPNLDNLPANASARMWQIQNGLGQFSKAQLALVDDDGNNVQVASAFRGSNGGQFTVLPRTPKIAPSLDQPQGSKALSLFDGNLQETFETPGYFRFSEDQQFALSYNSAAADPNINIAADVSITSDSGLPAEISSTIKLGGLQTSRTPVINPRRDINGLERPEFGEEVNIRQSAILDATGLPSGRYDYEILSQATYDCSTVAASTTGETHLFNRAESELGAGWAINGLQRLLFDHDGSVSIQDQDSLVTFRPEQSFTEFSENPLVFPGNGVASLAVADFNQDGLPDVAYTNSGTSEIGLIFNRGGQDFEQAQLIALPDIANSDVSEDLDRGWEPNLFQIAAIDINGDQLLDIAYGAQVDRRVGYLLNEGNGVFTPQPGPRNLGVRFRGLGVTDYNNDGSQDLIISYISPFGDDRFWLRTFTGENEINRTFFRGTSGGIIQLLIADMDGDELPDIVSRRAGDFKIFYNDDDLTLSETIPEGWCESVNPLGSYLAVGDFNEDGLNDAVASRSHLQFRTCFDRPKYPLKAVELFLNEGGRSFAAAQKIEVFPDRPWNEVTGRIYSLDANGDGHLDIVRNDDKNLAVYKGNGDGTFQPIERGALDYTFLDVNPFDINEDGSLDLISSQRFSVTIDFSSGPDPDVLIAADGEFSTLTQSDDGSWVRRYKDGTSAEFNAAGLQTAEVDRRGNRTEFDYGADGRLAEIKDQTGASTTFSYAASGAVESIEYPDGRVTTFDVNETGQLSEIVEPDGGRTRYRYDENNRLVAVTDQREHTTEHRYTSIGSYAGTLYPNGSSITNAAAASLGLENLGAPGAQRFVPAEQRVTEHVDEKGGVSNVTLNEFGAIIETVDPLGRITKYTRNRDNLVTRLERPTDNSDNPEQASIRIEEMDYDARGNMTALRMAVGTSVERERTYEYEPIFNNVVKFTDFDGAVTLYDYDEFGDLTKMTDSEGSEMIYSYNSVGLIQEMTDRRGNVTAYEYDLSFNRIQTVLPDLTTIEYRYDDRGNVIEQIEAVGTPEQRNLITEYDQENRVISVETVTATGISLDGKQVFEYDLVGNMVASIDETGLRSEDIYDEMNDLTGSNTPGYGQTFYLYNDASELVEEQDAEGAKTTWTYDIVGRVTQSVDAVGNTSIFEYDVSDNLVQVRDARENITSFGYDILERRISRTNPLDQTITMAYDPRDNLVQVTRETGDIETAIYDSLQRRRSVTTADNTLLYSYDPEGNLLTAADDDSALLMTYDSRDRLETVITDGTVGPQPATTLIYAYDGLSQRTSLTDSLGGVWSYGFDEKSRVDSITAPWGDAHNMNYDTAGRRTELVNTTGRQTVAQYASDRLSQLEHFQNAVPVARSGYSYAADGAVNVLRDLEDTSRSRTLAYDDSNRLLQVAEGQPAGDGGAPIPVEDYAYDANGNRTTSHLASNYVIDDHNRLLEDSSFTYAYDDKGNRTTRTRKSDGREEVFSYNSVNQLIAVTSSDGLSATYAYDAFGRRIAKTVNGLETAYVYDIGNFYDVTGHDRLLDFQDGILTKRWLHGQEIDEPVAYESYDADAVPGAGTAYALHADRQGSVIAVTEQATGSVVSRYVYDAFGQREQTISDIAQDYGFTGREFDAETGLYYYRARHYDPALGRFLQSDPLGFAAGDLNLYAYTWNDPANWSDPSGLTATSSNSKNTSKSMGMARAASRKVKQGVRCASKKISSFLTGLSRELGRGADLSQIRVTNLKCRVRVKAKKCGCGKGGALGNIASAFAAGYAAGGGFSSFPEGTEVLTPTGKVAIETLREGDMVIARDEENGVSGVFPVTAVMSRTSASILWLTLEDRVGETTRMGVTSEHPMFLEGDGWTNAGDIAPGDAIRDKDLQPLTVLAVELDETPRRVHNLEIAEAHTYFAGELEAWGHNARLFRGKLRDQVMAKNDGCCVRCGNPAEQADHILPWALGGETILENGQPLCASCNRQKSCKLPIEGLDLPWK